MHTRLLPVDSIKLDQERRWRRLAEESLDPNPFFEPEFVLPAARHLGGRAGQLLVVEENDRWLACLPVTPRATRLKAPVLSGWRSPYTFLGVPLLAPGAETLLPDLLLDGMTGKLTGAAVLDQVPVNSRAWAVLEDAIGAGELVQLARREFDRAAYDPTSSGPELTLSSRRRADLRRTRRRLEEELEAEVSFELVDPDETALGEFLRLEAAGWKGDEGTAFGAHDAHRRFFCEMGQNFAASGRYELWAMRCGGHTLAMVILLVRGEVRFAFKVAFDERFRKQAPGTQLIVEVTNRSIDGRLRRTDSCADSSNDMLNRLWPDRRRLVSVALATPGVRAGMLKRAIRATGVPDEQQTATG